MSGSIRSTYRVVVVQIVGWLFIVTAILKAAEPQDAMLAVAHLASAPSVVSLGIIAIIVLVELVLGALLVSGLWNQRMIYGSAALLGVFTLALLALIATDGPLSCGCGGRLFEWFPHQWSRETGIVRNLILIAALTPLLRHKHDTSESADGRRKDVQITLQGETT